MVDVGVDTDERARVIQNAYRNWRNKRESLFMLITNPEAVQRIAARTTQSPRTVISPETIAVQSNSSTTAPPVAIPAESAGPLECWEDLMDLMRLDHSVSQSQPDPNGNAPKLAKKRWESTTRVIHRLSSGTTTDPRAFPLVLSQWLEATDVHHRYGALLRPYYTYWLCYEAGINDGSMSPLQKPPPPKQEVPEEERTSDKAQPFFYWLDSGRGRHVDLGLSGGVSRADLESNRVAYLNPIERAKYVIKIDSDGLFRYQHSNAILSTLSDSDPEVENEPPRDEKKNKNKKKWIYVIDRVDRMYIGKKAKGRFHHSSFLSGQPVHGAGSLRISDGRLTEINLKSGHYHPQAPHLEYVVYLLQSWGVDMSSVTVNKALNKADMQAGTSGDLQRRQSQ